MENGVSRDHYTTEDFALDDDFCQWVLHPDSTSEIFWADWLARHPDQQEATAEARELVCQLSRIDKSAPMPLSKKEASFQRLLKKLDERMTPR